ncbi:MAG: thermonuclease family protein [Bacteroidetes bacterium]|nr:thermonuclease family protein [Bacteroidota bacterium]MBU1115670.1 thermonuclease family protein [Bacteroidota bacterium]MBU1799017.1 thermonuclease family protein [Bacteroidota bacterium]
MIINLYQYRAFVSKVYDGDTITVEIDLGFNAFLKGEKVRLNRINTPEITGNSREEGLKARDYLRLLILDKEILLETIKDRKGKYGRYLGEIFSKDENDNWFNINDHLVAKGFAKHKEY